MANNYIRVLLFTSIIVFCISCAKTDDIVLHTDPIEIISPRDNTSFEAGEKITFQVGQTDVGNMPDVDVYLDEQKIDIAQNSPLPDMVAGEHKLRLMKDGKIVDEVTFVVVEKEGPIDFDTLKPPRPFPSFPFRGERNTWCSYLLAFWDDQTRRERGHTGLRSMGSLVIKTREDWIQHWYKTVEAWGRDRYVWGEEPYYSQFYLDVRDAPPPEFVLNFSSDIVNFDEKDMLVVFADYGVHVSGYVDSIKDIQLLNGNIQVKFSRRALAPVYTNSIVPAVYREPTCHMVQIDNVSQPIDFIGSDSRSG